MLNHKELSADELIDCYGEESCYKIWSNNNDVSFLYYRSAFRKTKWELMWLERQGFDVMKLYERKEAESKLPDNSNSEC